MMDFNGLRAFLSAGESGSFSTAAQSLHLSQPAVSKRITLLEERLGARLFLRTGHGVRLTQAGDALMPLARSILGEVEAAERAVGNLAGNVAGPLSIVTNHHIGLWRLPEVFKRFTGDHPEVRLDLRFTDSEPAHQLVLDGAVELGVVTLAPQPPAQIVSLPLWKDTLRVVVGRDHALADAGSAGLADLARHRAVLPDLTTYTGRLVRSRMGELGLSLQDVVSTNYLETLRMMAETGLGWSLLPETMLGPELRTVDVPELTLTRELGLIHHRRHALSNAAEAFITEVSGQE
tara:strand:- start:707 stop:1579 length:873 start_codon:yes stop_codon:yes gene_type:complete